MLYIICTSHMIIIMGGDINSALWFKEVPFGLNTLR